MKNTIQISMLICLIALTTTVTAKSQVGIYLTASDFERKNISANDSKIRLNHSVLEMPYVTIIDHGHKKTLKKDAIYGYTDKAGNSYRFYNNSEYEIVEASGIYIYLKTEHIAQSKGFEVMKYYYFSVTPSGDIEALTLGNLKKAFRTNDKFIDLIDQFFSDGNLTEYDAVHHTFMLNYIYAKALKSE